VGLLCLDDVLGDDCRIGLLRWCNVVLGVGDMLVECVVVWIFEWVMIGGW